MLFQRSTVRTLTEPQIWENRIFKSFVLTLLKNPAYWQKMLIFQLHRNCGIKIVKKFPSLKQSTGELLYLLSINFSPYFYTKKDCGWCQPSLTLKEHEGRISSRPVHTRGIITAGKNCFKVHIYTWLTFRQTCEVVKQSFQVLKPKNNQKY